MRTLTYGKHNLGLALFTCLYLIISINITNAQCVATTAHSGSIIANDGSIGNLAFASPNNATASDNTRTSATAIAAVLSGNTNYLKVTGFNFSIPNLSNICGVRVDVENRASGLGIGAWIKDNEIKLVKNGVITGDNMVTSYDDWSSTETYHSYGGSSTNWNVSLTPADVNASDFGVVFSASFQGLAIVLPSAQIDHVRMTIFYDPSLPTHLISFTAAARGNQSTLTWKTADEEDGEMIILQRSLTGGINWEDIQRYDMHTGNQGMTYSFSERLNQPGDYSYRLETINVNGQKTFSETRKVRINSASSLLVYPNPAHDFLTIEGTLNSNTVQLTNPFFQLVNKKILNGNDGKFRLDLRDLAKGIYYGTIGGEKFSFVKL